MANKLRDVTEIHSIKKSNPQNDFHHLIYETILFIFKFLKKPSKEMLNLPNNWTWVQLIATLFGVAFTSGFISGFFPLTSLSELIYSFLNAIFIRPIYSLVLNGSMALFLYYYFQVFERRTIEFKKIFMNIFFSLIPFFVFYIGANLFQPVILLGFAISSYLLIIGLTENFNMDKKRAIKLILAVYFTVSFYLWYRTFN